MPPSQVDIDDIAVPVVIVSTPDGHIQAANRAAFTEFGFTPEELGSRSVRDILRGVAPADDALLTRLFQAEAGLATQCEIKLSIGDGHVRDYLLRAHVVSAQPDRLALLVTSDLTDERERERNLTTDARRLRTLIDANFDAYYDWHVDSNYHEWSPQLDALLGLPPGETFPQLLDAWADRLHPDEAEAVLRRLRRSIQQAEPYMDEYRLRTETGEYRLVSDRGSPIVDEAGRVTDLVGVMRDITNERQAQAALDESAALYLALFRAATNPVIRTDAEGSILDANEAALPLLGIDGEEVQGHNLADYVDERARSLLKQFRETRWSAGSAIVETAIEVSGEERHLRFSVVPCAVAGATTLFWLGTDISDLRSATDELLQSEDMLRERNLALREQIHALRALLESERMSHSEAVRAHRASLESLVEPMLDRLARLIGGRPESVYLEATAETIRDLFATFYPDAQRSDTCIGPSAIALTRREHEIARLIRLGKTSQEIAGLLHLSHSTVSFHRRSIRRKLGVSGAPERLGTLL